MTSFFKRMLLFCSPFFILILVYIITDPFKIIYHYDNFNNDNHIYKNRDFISTEMYLNNSKKYIYDSFIFGASTAVCIPPSIWKKHILTSNKIFSFDASSENIIGIWSKIKYIDKSNSQIKNALFVFDTGITFKEFINDIPALMKHYQIYPSSKINFHLKYFTSYLNAKLLIALAHYRLSNHLYPYMRDVFDDRLYHYDTITNEIYTYARNNELKEDSLSYYNKRSKFFPPRSKEQLFFDKQINDHHISMLKDIQVILKKKNTDFRIVITPLYDQVAINREDLKLLYTIFGRNNIFDFSGINKFTEKISNYYDNLHFKPYVGAEILDSIYHFNTNKSLIKNSL